VAAAQSESHEKSRSADISKMASGMEVTQSHHQKSGKYHLAMFFDGFLKQYTGMHI
jgi:formate dehydrogenase assembly factor FdhD